MTRWNGPEPPHNTGRPGLVPRDATKLRGQVVWIAQQVPARLAHFEMGLFTRPAGSKLTGVPIRASMDSVAGLSPADVNNNAPNAAGGGDFPFAHESGHGISLGDEYVEVTFASYFLPGLCNYGPGSPFFTELPPMMNGGKTVQARYAWHLAEWARVRAGTPALRVEHAGHAFDQGMMAGKNDNQRFVDHVGLSDDDFADFLSGASQHLFQLVKIHAPEFAESAAIFNTSVQVRMNRVGADVRRLIFPAQTKIRAS
jgi:hypothetical protein